MAAINDTFSRGNPAEIPSLFMRRNVFLLVSEKNSQFYNMKLAILL